MVNLADKLNHKEIMIRIEEKLLDAVRAKWLEHALSENLLDCNDVSKLFPNLLTFLLKFKKMADYKLSDIDVTQSSNKSKYTDWSLDKP